MCLLPTEQPRSLLDEPITSNIMQTTATLSWVDPGGDVDAYIIRLAQNVPPHLVINVSVYGNITSTMLEGLEPDTSYTVEVFSMNQNGLSIPSPLTQFDTLRESYLYFSPSRPLTTCPLTHLSSHFRYSAHLSPSSAHPYLSSSPHPSFLPSFLDPPLSLLSPQTPITRASRSTCTPHKH